MKNKFLNKERQMESKEKIFSDYQELFDLIKNTDIALVEENENWSLDKIEDRLLESFKTDGQRALEANQGTIYTTLSGGLDSTLAIAFLRKNFPDAKIVTFTMGGNENHPDIKFARQASEKFNTQSVEIIPDKDEIQETLEQYKRKFSESDLKKAVETGDFDVFLLFKNISQLKPKVLLSYDGIDELMGGYWNHRKENTIEQRRNIFNDYWKRLTSEHLTPLINTSESFDIKLLFPYLDEKLIKLISKIPVNDRASDKIGKKPLREIATHLDVPEEIIKRQKMGQVDMTKVKEFGNI